MSMRRKSGRGTGKGRRPTGRRRMEFEEEEAPRKRGSRGQKKDGFDWSVADDDDRGDDDDDRDDEYEFDDAPRERKRKRRGSSRPAKRRQTLMDLCTPFFSQLAILPAKPEDPQPPYQPYRTQIVETLDRIVREAPENGIEAEDANQACYGLSFLADTLVGDSAWNGKLDWSGEPLGIVRFQDPEGGRNFFHRLDGFGERQRAVKEVYLVCLALGFRGQYAELEPTQQAAKLADLKQQIIRDIRPQSFEKLPELFPEAYEPADSIEGEVPPAPRWWWGVSIGVVILSAAIWVGLFIWAGSSPRTADGVVQEQLEFLMDEQRPQVEAEVEEDDGETP